MICCRFFQTLGLSAAFFISLTFGEEKRGDNPDAKPSTALEQLARFTVPPGFEVQLVADESQIQKPMNLNFDAMGRLWVTGTTLYPWAAREDADGKRIAAWEQEWNNMAGNISGAKPKPPAASLDTVRVLGDFGPDGRARKVEIFADGLNVPIGVVPLPREPGAKGDTVIVYSIPGIWRLEDTDGDGKADKREALYTGFGFTDTHGMSSNYLLWLDGWIYGCHGFKNRSAIRNRAGHVIELESGNTYRFRPDGSRFEIVTHGQTNPFGLTVDWWGNFYSSDSHSKPVYLLLPGAHYEGIGKKHDGLGYAPAITNDSHGSSAIAGIAWYADDKFPADYRGNVFIGNPVTQRINRDHFDWQGSTPMAVREPDFLTCSDPWFRPVQVKLGPDGAIYIADFYNPIIGHYEQPLMDPRRDHVHGRIWRVVWRGENKDTPIASPPALTSLTSAQLVEKLGDANLIVRMLAANVLVARNSNAKSGGAVLNLFPDGQNDGAQAAALWVAERIGSLPLAKLVAALDSASDEVAVQAVRILGERTALPPEQAQALREKLPAVPANVQRAIVQALARHPSVENIAPLTALARSIDGGKDLELKHALRVTLREHLLQSGLYAALNKAVGNENAVLLADVSLAVPTPESANFLLQALADLDYQTPRAGEYLSHAAKHLPAARLGELTAVTDKLQSAPFAQQLALADGLKLAARERGLALPGSVSQWIQRVLITALASKDVRQQDRAIDALRDSTDHEKFEPLMRIVEKVEPTNGQRRAAALEALMNLPQAAEVLARAIRDTSNKNLQLKAADLIATRGEFAIAKAALPTASVDTLPILARGLAKTDAGCADLIELIEQGKVPATVLRQAALVELVSQRPTALRDRVITLTKNLPPEDARLNGIIAMRLATFRKVKPNADHGAQVFRTICIACHKYRNEGGSLAPSLDGVAVRGADRLAEDILDPSRSVDAAFRQTVIETKDNRTIAGINLRETVTTVTVTDVTGQNVTLSRTGIKSQNTSALSIMPAVIDSLISENDFADLLAYLLKP